MLLIELEQDDDEVLRKMAIEMKSKFDKYWLNSEWDDFGMLFAFAYILDPRCKLSVLNFCYKSWLESTVATLKVEDVRLKLKILYEEYARGTSSDINTNTTRTPMRNEKRKFDYFAKYDNEEAFSCSVERSPLDLYLTDPKMDRTTKLNILDFWKEKEHRYKELSHLARDIVSVPLTTVASESTFSIGGRILNKWRSSYLPENVGALITSRSWLFGNESNEDDEFVGCDVDWRNAKS